MLFHPLIADHTAWTLDLGILLQGEVLKQSEILYVDQKVLICTSIGRCFILDYSLIPFGIP